MAVRVELSDGLSAGPHPVGKGSIAAGLAEADTITSYSLVRTRSRLSMVADVSPPMQVTIIPRKFKHMIGSDLI